MRRGLRFRTALLVGLVATGTLALVLAGAGTAQASGKNSLDLCVVEPGYAMSGDSFGLTTTGPKSFHDTQTFSASACGSYTALPNAGAYTVTQSQTPSGWHLGGIYCYSPGTANHPNGSVDLSSDSTTVSVHGPASCLFAELQGGSGSSSSGSSGFSGGSSSSGSSSSGGTTTTKPGSSTTTPTTTGTGITGICQRDPAICAFPHEPVAPIAT